MRWESLFDDLEAQLSAAAAVERDAHVADLIRAERATVELVDRLRGALGRELELRCHGGAVARGELVDVAAAWALLAEGTRRHLVPLPALGAVGGLGPRAAPTDHGVLRRLGLGHALRALARDRVQVRLVTAVGDLSGRIEAVGADHLDLGAGAVESRGERPLWAVPFTALRMVSSS